MQSCFRHTHTWQARYSHSTCIMSVSQLVQCSFGIKLHLKQNCFNGLCTQLCSICPYNSATCRVKICSDLNPFEIELQILQIRSRPFKWNLCTSNWIARCVQIVIKFPVMIGIWPLLMFTNLLPSLAHSSFCLTPRSLVAISIEEWSLINTIILDLLYPFALQNNGA